MTLRSFPCSFLCVLGYVSDKHMVNASYAPTYLIGMSEVHDKNSIRKTFVDGMVIGTSLSEPYMSEDYMSLCVCLFVYNQSKHSNSQIMRK